MIIHTAVCKAQALEGVRFLGGRGVCGTDCLFFRKLEES